MFKISNPFKRKPRQPQHVTTHLVRIGLRREWALVIPLGTRNTSEAKNVSGILVDAVNAIVGGVKARVATGLVAPDGTRV